MNDTVDSDNKLTECICPRCEKTHFLILFWVGENTPRKFCKRCEGFATRGGELAKPYGATYKFGD